MHALYTLTYTERYAVYVKGLERDKIVYDVIFSFSTVFVCEECCLHP